jgi:anti-sigma factor RsiW
MPSAAEIARRSALVASHHRPVAAEARHQDRQKRQTDPTSQPMAVAVRALAGVNVVAFGVGHAVVEKTFGARQASGGLDGAQSTVRGCQCANSDLSRK